MHMLVGRCNPNANVMISHVGQGHWAFDELVWLEREVELQWVDVQQLASLRRPEKVYLQAIVVLHYWISVNSIDAAQLNMHVLLPWINECLDVVIDTPQMLFDQVP